MKVCAGRRKGTPWRNRVPEVFEVLLICFCTAVTSYPNRYTAVLSSATIRSLFHACADTGPTKPDMMDLCSGLEPRTDLALSAGLLAAGLLRFVQMVFTFGAGVPAGLFVPCLFTGACLGRVVGFGAHYINSLIPGSAVVVNPGVYAMVGAASVLGGVCRVTISLVVIMFELTDGLQMVVPFMCACLVAKFVGDYFTDGIYDCAIRLRGYPYLHEPDEAAFHICAKDVMDEELETVDCEETTVDGLLSKMRSSAYSGFPPRQVRGARQQEHRGLCPPRPGGPALGEGAADEPAHRPRRARLLRARAQEPRHRSLLAGGRLGLPRGEGDAREGGPRDVPEAGHQ
eukprot:CAMPEP_0175266068 /NCGR_PEP_ID=MMETSP0093-20121207/43142_1 /TAXON_ID=311494 /ORGANISM="Alexandrium monilatum, Strain CCMP3105" /LENGTH=342 /DNA_ID=CAMNT_0016560661 /DNA_START=25 /DNA_END=1050 /DNA_ORIENTATION=+